MTRRRMFLRMITASLLRRRSRMLIALLSIGIGATILAGLVTIYVDVPRQMGAQFRSFGANMLLLADEGKSMTAGELDEALKTINTDQLVGAAPYRYRQDRHGSLLRQRARTSARLQKQAPTSAWTAGIRRIPGKCWWARKSLRRSA